MLEKQKQLEKTVKKWDNSAKEVESLPQIISGVRRKLDEPQNLEKILDEQVLMPNENRSAKETDDCLRWQGCRC